MGFDARELTPMLVYRSVLAAGHVRSHQKAETVMAEIDGQRGHRPKGGPAKTIERLVNGHGHELAGPRGCPRDAPAGSGNSLAQTPADPPALAVVECDGGRIRTRQPGNGPGVTLDGKGWKETKNACLIRATHQTFTLDPQPEPPECFCDPQHVAKIAETEALSVASPVGQEVTVAEEENGGPSLPIGDWRPQRLVRTVLSSMASSDGPRGYPRPADGPRSESPPLRQPQDAWDQYLVWMRGCWQGEIAQVLEELAVWQSRLGEAPPDAADTGPREVLRICIQYLTHNRQRMNYPAYRRQGLPVPSAWMESLVKEINWRVKGTEMFWNNPAGAEAILQIRAAILCDDDRLKAHHQTRPGYPFTRRPKPASLTKEKKKS